MRPKTPRLASLFVLVAAVAIGFVLGAGQGSETQSVQGVFAENAAGQADRADLTARVARGQRGRRGPRGYRGRPGPRGPQGPPGPRGGDAITDFSINWRRGGWAGRESAEATLTGVGKLSATCRPIEGNENGQHRLVLTPSGNGVRTVLNVSVSQASEIKNTRYTSDSSSTPIDIELPINGMLTAVVSIEPIGGDGGPGPTPWSIQASSEMKLNGPSGEASTQNFCYVAMQAARGE